MSVSSGTTLISPSNQSTTGGRSQAPTTQPPVHRRTSGPSNHHTSHAHGHGAHTHGNHAKRKGSVHSTGRRGSETEQGRRALTAGLAMHGLEGAAAEGSKGQRRTSLDVSQYVPNPRRHLRGLMQCNFQKPALKKSSRSDTHLPRLSRTTSNASNISVEAATRPKPTHRKRSGESVQIVSEEGKKSGEEVDSGEEGWEESDQDSEQAGPSFSKVKGKSKSIAEASTPMRRTQSDTAQPPSRASRSIMTSPLALQAVNSNGSEGSGSHSSHPRQRTLGFAGAHAIGDPQANAQRHINEAMPHWNDSMHVMPAHQLHHQKSVSSLRASPEDTQKESMGGSKLRPGSVAPDEDGSPEDPAPPIPPQLMSESPQSAPMNEDGPRAAKNRYSAPPSQTRQRIPSEPHRMKHRASNSSLRSLQSFRVPPHPLNSPTGYRSGQPIGSSPISPDRPRGPSTHHPPLAPPVVHRELVTGHGWDIPEDDEFTSSPVERSATMPNGSGSGDPRPKGRRQISVSSTKSLQSLLHPTTSSSTGPVSPAKSVTSQRRRTALEATAKAAKYQTTNDPILYHHSLGHSSTSAETAHLISRFLPSKKVPRPTWEISVDNLDTHSGIGLSKGDYREAHESLLRSMREMGVSQPTSKQASRRMSYQSLLGTQAKSETEPEDVQGMGVGVGMVNGRNGPMVVARGGGWRGKTPFELSVERCLAQRPVRPYGVQ